MTMTTTSTGTTSSAFKAKKNNTNDLHIPLLHHNHPISKSTFLSLSIIHIAIRISLSNLAPITDCDEVYNYWEPLHFLTYGSGMQTWEYAPQFALRTYAYLFPMSVLSSFYEKILNFLCTWSSDILRPSASLASASPDKVLIFHLLRASISTLTSVAELHLVYTLASYYSIDVAIYTWILLLTSTGMFHAAPALLPSATVMLCMCFSLSYQIQAWWWYCYCKDYSHDTTTTTTTTTSSSSSRTKIQSLFNKAIIIGLIAILMTGWPFCAVLFIPLGLYAIYITFAIYNNNNNNNATTSTSATSTVSSLSIPPTLQIIHLFKRVVVYTLFIQGIVMIIDYFYYQKIISPTMNIFIYNTGFSFFHNNNNNNNNNHYYNNSSNVTFNRDELYGVEDVSYYIKNLILNWNMTSILGVLALPFLILVQLCNEDYKKDYKSINRNKRKNETNVNNNKNNKNSHHRRHHHHHHDIQKLQVVILVLLPMILWISIVFTRPHKEERFLFPIYPMLAIGTAMIMEKILDLIPIHLRIGNIFHGKGFSIMSSSSSSSDNEEECKKITHHLKITCGLCLLLPMVLFSLSRSMVLSDGYTAPLKLYEYLHHDIIISSANRWNKSEMKKKDNSDALNEPILVCTGGEWYRYPSSYHLPDIARLAFLKSSFSGQLPQQFTKYGSKEESLTIQNGRFNDMNEEEMDRYVDINKCSYVVGLLDDSDLSANMKMDKNRKWIEIARHKFLDADNTSLLHRVLFLPFKRKATYQSYVLFKVQGQE